MFQSNNLDIPDLNSLDSLEDKDLAELELLLSQEEADKGLKDLYYFDKHILGYKDMEPKTHKPVCAFIENTETKKKHLEQPRGTFKTSVITIGHTIQSVAEDPNIRILIDNEVYNNSKAFLREIKAHMEKPDVLALYPQLTPNKRINEGWTESTVIVSARTKVFKEPTISCAGLDQIKVGMHYDMIIMDDLVSPRNVTSREQIDKVIEHYRLALSLLEPGGRIIIVGTRYNYADLYGYLLKNEADTFDHLIIPARIKPDVAEVLNRRFPEVSCEFGLYKTGDLFFPERLTDDFLKDQRKSQGTYIYNCQYMLDPVDADSADFRREWLRYYRGHLERNPDTGKEILVVDWMGDSKRQTLDGYEFPIKVPISKIVTIDPNNKKKKTSDYTGAITNAIGTDSNWYILDIDRDILNPGQIVNRVFDLHDKYDPEYLGLEEVGKEAIQYMLVQRMRKEGRFFKYHELKTGGVAKEDRIKRLIPRFEYGTIFLPTSIIKSTSMGTTTDMVEAFEDEYMYFPVAKNDDIIDALAYQEDLVALLNKRSGRSGRVQGKATTIGHKKHIRKYMSETEGVGNVV